MPTNKTEGTKPMTHHPEEMNIGMGFASIPTSLPFKCAQCGFTLTAEENKLKTCPRCPKPVETEKATMSLNRSLTEMIEYRHKLRTVCESLLKYAEDTYPRCPSDQDRESEETIRRKQLIESAKEILYNTAIPESASPASAGQPEDKVCYACGYGYHAGCAKNGCKCAYCRVARVSERAEFNEWKKKRPWLSKGAEDIFHAGYVRGMAARVSTGTGEKS